MFVCRLDTNIVDQRLDQTRPDQTGLADARGVKVPSSLDITGMSAIDVSGRETAESSAVEYLPRHTRSIVG